MFAYKVHGHRVAERQWGFVLTKYRVTEHFTSVMPQIGQFT